MSTDVDREPIEVAAEPKQPPTPRAPLKARRRIPRPRELWELLRPRPFQLSAIQRRLARAHTIDDLRTAARRRVPRPVFDYVDGGAEQETSVRRNRAAFERIEFRPHALIDVSEVDTSTTILGRSSPLPFALGPTGLTRMMNHHGERAVGRVADQAGLAYSLSTLGTVSIEELPAIAPNVPLWFQLYVSRDRGLSAELVRRAKRAGYHALMVTVDAPVAGNRLRDLYNGLTIPPSLSLKTFFSGVTHPGWSLNLLTTEPFQFASLADQGDSANVAGILNKMFDPKLSWADLEWLRELWDGPLIIKGIQRVEDAERAAAAGVEAITLSNHGGRQLDRSPAPLELLPRVVDAVGDSLEVYVDSGVRTGADIVGAVALGARACLIGRAYLYGLTAGGAPGVARALDILTAEVTRTMALVGVTKVSDLGREHVRLLPSSTA